MNIEIKIDGRDVPVTDEMKKLLEASQAWPQVGDEIWGWNYVDQKAYTYTYNNNKIAQARIKHGNIFRTKEEAENSDFRKEMDDIAARHTIRQWAAANGVEFASQAEIADREVWFYALDWDSNNKYFCFEALLDYRPVGVFPYFKSSADAERAYTECEAEFKQLAGVK